MNTENILFIDIETVSGYSDFDQMPEEDRKFWSLKSRQLLTPEQHAQPERIAACYSDRAAIYAEYGKIICISVGVMVRSKESPATFRVKSFYGKDEKLLLEQLFELVELRYNDSNRTGFCGHNIREFDIPYICRRAVIHGLKLPTSLHLMNKKPWEVKHILDTLDMWKFGDHKHYISLALLAYLLDIPTPKDDIDGSMVGCVFWKEDDLDRIKTYCQKDVVTVAHVYTRLNNEEFVDVSEIHFIENQKQN
ncbi:MAG TPA: ribonuclease H-like domain-containing protein [Saprospiraceae bacterium]|nr:ribonuclease H-like domain-containing protein [Saprospiraceae bacterium]HQW56748.1 ribonuclease H-like domain-containing protein [Saprospiraceae bacterium]